MKYLLRALLPIALSSSAFAEVPHKFEAATPARAAEVNANFEYIEKRTVGSSAINVTYNYIEKSPGDTVSIGGASYSIYRIPYHDPVSGKNFSVLFPAKAGSSNIISTNIGALNKKASFTNISGLDSSITSGCIVNHDPAIEYFNHSCEARVNLNMPGDTVFSIVADEKEITYSNGESQGISKLNDFDFVFTNPKNTIFDPSSVVDEFIDYIKVEEISP
ncbi:Uncharacterised protein [BD1-7 clade bacterium]|uniref:Uncharacterized protein n=1 Tax=BD1-7 clade bacterium TaxID=2029982 RepID=A0A5S9QJM7_9GAMM|nr:Uncharacterised protein [BD1-7 clade bacterium]